MNLDAAPAPAPRGVPHSLLSGVIAVSVVVPLFLCAILLGGSQTRWEYLLAASACLFVAVVYVAAVVAVGASHPRTSDPVTVGVVLVCLALAAVGLVALSTPEDSRTLLTGILVVVVFVSLFGERAFRIGVAGAAVVVVALVGAADGLAWRQGVTVVVVYAAAVVLITWIISRTMDTMAVHLRFRHSFAALTEALDDMGPDDLPADDSLVREVLARGLPLVNDILPAERVTIFVRNPQLARFEPLLDWTDESARPLDASTLPELAEALRTDDLAFAGRSFAAPIGLCIHGDLVLHVERRPGDPAPDHRPEEIASFLAAAFLRATTRANLASGFQADLRTDPLTGLPGRQALFDRLRVEMDRALRSEQPLTLAMADLDRFTEYNERFGQGAGDAVLRAVSALMVSNVRAQDLVVRCGGEEFCLLLPDTDVVGGHYLLDKLRAGGRTTTSQTGVTLSAGLTSWDGVEDATSLLHRAGEALQRAKDSGRDRVVSIQLSQEL